MLAPPTLTEYRLVVSCKTTVIFRLGCVVLMAQSGAVPSMSILSLLVASRRGGQTADRQTNGETDRQQGGAVCDLFRAILDIVEDIGHWFQVRDDLRNLTSYEDVKGFCDDFSEGKWSYPVLVFVELCQKRHEASAEEFLGLLAERPTDLPTKRRMLNMLKEGGADYAITCSPPLPHTLPHTPPPPHTPTTTTRPTSFLPSLRRQ